MTATTLVGFILGFFTFVGFIFTTSYPEWKKTSLLDTDGPMADVVVLEGLWMRCSIPDVGLLSCDTYDASIFGIPVMLTTVRAIMILCCSFAFTSLVLAVLAMDCVHAFNGNTKTWTGRVSGLLMAIASLFCIFSVSYYARDVIVKYDYAMTSGITQVVFVYGTALYIGWVAGGLGIISTFYLGVAIRETHRMKSHTTVIVQRNYKRRNMSKNLDQSELENYLLMLNPC